MEKNDVNNEVKKIIENKIKYRDYLVEMQDIINKSNDKDANINELEDRLMKIILDLHKYQEVYANLSLKKLNAKKNKYKNNNKNNEYNMVLFLINQKEWYSSHNEKVDNLYDLYLKSIDEDEKYKLEQEKINKEKNNKEKIKIENAHKKKKLSILISSLILVDSLLIGVCLGYPYKNKNNNNSNNISVESLLSGDSIKDHIEKEIISNDATTESALDSMSEEDIEEFIDKNYNINKKFYDEQEITKEDLSNIIFLINGKFSMISENDLDTILNNINKIIIPDKYVEKIVSINNKKANRYYDNSIKIDAKIPSIANLVIDTSLPEYNYLKSFDLTEAFIYQNLRLDTYGENLSNTINGLVINNEKDKDDYIRLLNNTNIGVNYLVASCMDDLVSYCRLVNPDKVSISRVYDNKEYSYKIDKTDSEKKLSDKINDYYSKRIGDAPSEKELNEYIKTKNSIIDTKYENLKADMKNKMKTRIQKKYIYFK